ncbi:SDR family oxidoreductase [Variovorax sp. GB1P17]|uniref:SDR family oxidoreductase n=1 Tax=Variovorax sp. GB1P17 TaxID=3443740 RepID=UPI003F445BAC
MKICEQRTVVITGAGGGLGRAYALAFAEAGAQVVVNDIRLDAAQEVADTIAAAGGQALANSDDITTMRGAQDIVAQAIARFGDVHVLVNNAGNLRDRMFVSMSDEDWDEVMRVHLRGHFCLSNTLARHWRDRKKAGASVDARIINTSSGAGLQGSVGQSNYSCAKAGIAALTLVQAAELRRYDISVNALAPAARTAMTQSTQEMAARVRVPTDDSFDFWDPANVASLVVFLGSPLSAHITGRVFEASGGQVSLSDGWRVGALRDKGARWDPAELGPVIDALIAEAATPQPVYGA